MTILIKLILKKNKMIIVMIRILKMNQIKNQKLKIYKNKIILKLKKKNKKLKN